jgi:hypothetical protein
MYMVGSNRLARYSTLSPLPYLGIHTPLDLLTELTRRRTLHFSQLDSMASAIIPQEILSLIADYTAIWNDKLTPYTLINKSWQFAFERRIYASIVVSSPSATTRITTGINSYHRKRGLSLESLDKLTNARKSYIRRITYRVAVPYWLDVLRIKTENYTYDNSWRLENNQAFSEGVSALFEYLSTAWTQQTISLDIALQAEYAYVSDEDDNSGHEPNTYPFSDGLDDDVAPYCADFAADWSLPSAKCITSLQFLELGIPSRIPDQYSPDGYRTESENKISVPAILKIAAACGALQTLQLAGEYGIPSTEPAMREHARDATAAALSHLPPSVQSLHYTGDLMNEFDGPDETRSPDMALRKQDLLCTAFHKISTQLRSLHIDGEVVFPELFCPLDEGPQGLLQTHWPYLQTLHLQNIDESFAFSALARYADGSASDEILLDRYMDDLYTTAGYAAQKMPRLKDLVVRFMYSHELSFGYDKGECDLMILKRSCDTYVPSARVLEAWKVPGEQLEFCPKLHSLVARYTSWPPV